MNILFSSFLDDAFRKNLESALRFGNPLLVQDVESYDPILNPVLNRELRRTGGRVLITLGDQDIDLSPSFTIFLSTRDPTVSLFLLCVLFESQFSSDLPAEMLLFKVLNFSTNKEHFFELSLKGGHEYEVLPSSFA